MTDLSSRCLLFFDWDNTLAIKCEVSEANVRALEAARAAGHRLVLNTGRSFGYIPDAAFECAKWDGVIASSSFAALLTDGEVRTLYEKYLGAEALCRSLAFFRMHSEELRYIVFEGRNEAVNPYELSLTEDFIRENAAEMKVSNVTVGCDLSAFPDFPVEGGDLICHENYSEFLVEGMDKGTLMPLFCELFNIPVTQTVAFGDSVNDEGMFRAAGTSVLIPGEAYLPAVTPDYTAHSRAEGVAEAIAYLFGL